MGANSSTVDRRQATTDQAKAQSGNRNIVTETGGLTISDKSKLLQPGSVDLAKSGFTNSVVNIGDTTGEAAKQLSAAMQAQTAAAAATAQAQSQGSADTFKSLLESQTVQTGNILTTLATQSAGTTSAMSSMSKSALDQVGSLAASSQTGGISMLNKTFLWVALGAFALIGLIFLVSRRK